MPAGGGGALLSACAGGASSRLVTVQLRPASRTPGSNSSRLARSARTLPGAKTAVAGYGAGSARRASWPTPGPILTVVVTLAAHVLFVAPGGAGSRGLAGTRDSGWLNICQPELVSLSSA